MNYNIADDTIAAISTALSPSGIGIIRVSGPDAIRIVDRIFCFAHHSEKERSAKKLSDVKSHTLHYGKIEKDGILYDEVLVSVMRAPSTYTREDVVEINCHGGPFVCRKVLDLVLAAGARCAEPGEFTKRAFLNGRLKLTEAEAVMDVISAENDYALQNGAAQLSGSVQRKIQSLRENLLSEIAYIEAALDDPEHMSLDGYAEELEGKTEQILSRMEKLIRQSENGRIMKEGVKTAIVGKPNVGKSSLLNALLGENRAIVTDIAGTTRDTLEETVYFHGITLHLIDTAGIRKTEDAVEKIGVERAVETVKQADLVLFVVDGAEKITQEDMEIRNIIGEKKAILIKNKTDLIMEHKEPETEQNLKYVNERKLKDESATFYISEHVMNEIKNDPENEKSDLADNSKDNLENNLEDMLRILCQRDGIPVIALSAKTQEGMEALEEQIEKMFYMEDIRPNSQVYLTNARQKEALCQAYESMKLVKQSIADGMPEDFFSIDLTDAYEYLGKMIGETLEDDVAEQIFSRFCMGK
ncbi:MAG: tRNA uridine-5-carboxymethylaminomethyl(34) synthesis GTPase MnmE [Lachnospiraceae bacterium]|nr:tRNA uridine-5-carboxymethylaminomethyl(34) synthesis GTPase MnmE [Lachnospiraceae bacterium]